MKDTNPICSNCNGSGEGMHEGTLCYVCHGRGTVKTEDCDSDCDSDYYEEKESDYESGD